MKYLRKAALVLYPVLILSIAATLLARSETAHAGRIRTIQLTQVQPGKVVLALGHSTAISFPVKPERLVLGSPGSINVDFLGNDVTITPKSHSPGNLLVYTKSGRYVILFDIGSASTYDDVANIRFGETLRPLKLMEDTYNAVSLKIVLSSKTKGVKAKTEKLTGLMISNELRIESLELAELSQGFKRFRCQGCALSRKDSSLQIQCGSPIKNLRCEADGYSSILIERGSL